MLHISHLMSLDFSHSGPAELTLADPAELGSLVVARRRTLGLTRAEAAGRLGVDPSALFRLEQGQGGMAVGTVLGILQLLGVDLVARSRDGAPLWTTAASAQRVRRRRQ
jgi:transcriptional regulator with XRE-family HTH domain